MNLKCPLKKKPRGPAMKTEPGRDIEIKNKKAVDDEIDVRKKNQKENQNFKIDFKTQFSNFEIDFFSFFVFFFYFFLTFFPIFVFI